MKWYGFKNSLFTKKNLINMKLNNNFKTKNLSLVTNLSCNLNKNKIFFYIPHNWKFIFFKGHNENKFTFNVFYLYSNFYFFFLPITLNVTELYCNNQLNLLFIQTFFNNNFYKLYWTLLKKIFYSFNRYFFRKLKFKGKGYYIYKNKRNTIAMQFGYSHRIRIFFFFLHVKFLSKTIVLIFGLNNTCLTKGSIHLKNIRSINIFTSKGIRFSRQILYKKTGKISSYR
jgi:ribosomal protein L6P/L9E